MKQVDLARSFLEFYGGTVTSFAELFDGTGFRGDWLAGMVRSHRNVSHPLQHLLLQQFLEGRETTSEGFGPGPWHCLNPLADHSGDNTIAKVRLSRNRGHEVGVFECECGYVYTRRLNTQTRQIEPPRFQRYGPLLERELRRLVASGLGQREIARRLHLDPKSVARSAHIHRLNVTWRVPHRTKRISGGHGAGRLPVARCVRDANSQNPARTRSSMDWDAIDQGCAKKLAAAANSILCVLPPIRVTPAEIERRLGGREWVTKRLSKLPRSAAVLADVVENERRFQERRIQYAIAALSTTGRPVRAWRVVRMAGLRSSAMRRVRELMKVQGY